MTKGPTMWVMGVLMALVVLLGLAGAPESRAGIDDVMRNQFDAMVNATPPSYSNDAQGGVVSGGSMVIRNQVMSASLFSYQLPHLDSGCGGWDLFGGSFSFISAQQIVAMVRSIASNAVAYAFHLALTSISHQIDSTLTSLFKDMNLTNINSMNSCNIAKSLDNAILGTGDTGANQAAANQSANSGTSSDNLAATNQGQSQSPSVQASQSNPQLKSAIVKGNQVWAALKNETADQWAPGADNDFMEALLSISGTIVVCDPNDNPCAAGQAQLDQDAQQDLQRTAYAPTMKLADLIDGSSDGRVVKLLVCSDDDCLRPTAQDMPNFIGLRRYIEMKLLQGTCADIYTSGCGLLGRYATVTSDYSKQDKQLIGLLGPLMADLEREARNNEDMAREHAQKIIPILAADLAEKVASESVKAMSGSMAAMGQGVDADAVAKIKDAASDIVKEHAAYIQGQMASLEVYRHIAEVRQIFTGGNQHLPTAIQH